MTLWCGRHHHKSAEGMTRCLARTADRKLTRNGVLHQESIPEPVAHQPGRRTMRGRIPIAVFAEDRRFPY